jgi:Ankyrin repeats (3 copies)
MAHDSQSKKHIKLWVGTTVGILFALSVLFCIICKHYIDMVQEFAMQGNTVLLGKLLNRYPILLNIRSGFISGYTPLMAAACSCHLDTVQMLLQHGASTDIDDGKGFTVFDRIQAAEEHLNMGSDGRTYGAIWEILEQALKNQNKMAITFTNPGAIQVNLKSNGALPSPGDKYTLMISKQGDVDIVMNGNQIPFGRVFGLIECRWLNNDMFSIESNSQTSIDTREHDLTIYAIIKSNILSILTVTGTYFTWSQDNQHVAYKPDTRDNKIIQIGVDLYKNLYSNTNVQLVSNFLWIDDATEYRLNFIEKTLTNEYDFVTVTMDFSEPLDIPQQVEKRKLDFTLIQRQQFTKSLNELTTDSREQILVNGESIDKILSH